MRTHSLSSQKHFAVAVVIGVLTSVVGLLSGCGSGGSTVAPPPPNGPFSNASLNGTYAFAFTGQNSSGFFAVAGSFTADGNGHITAGVEDVNSAGSVFPNLAISGTYSIGGDGRGTATLNSALNPFTLAFVVISSQRALLVRFDTFATGSGTIDLQNPAAFSTAALQGSFAVNLAGIDPSSAPLATGATLTTDNTGTITSGVQDFNDGGVATLNQALTGSWTVAANGRGTAVFTTAVATLNLAFYVVDSTHVKMVEIDANASAGGDAFRQQGPFSAASVSGSFPFTLGGSSTVGPFVAGGIFNANGTGTITGGVEDVNNNGVLAQNLNVSGSYTMAANGRGTLVLTTTSGTSNFIIYPSMGGVQILETDAIIISSGTALAQSGAPFSNGSLQGAFGLNMTGALGGAEIDTIAQFAANGGGTLSGAMDFNNGGALFSGLALTGSYSMANTGRGTMSLHTSSGTLNLDVYAVSATKALFIEVDAGLPAVGTFEHQ